MNPLMKVKISRDGVEIAVEELQNIEGKLRAGAIKLTDHYWHEGMTQWQTLSLLVEKFEQISNARKEEHQARLERDKISAEKLRRKSEYFKCSCCRKSFEFSIGEKDRFSSGFFLILTSFFFGFICAGIISSSPSNPSTYFWSGLVLFCSTLSFIAGLGYILSAFVRSPSCPNCGSSNFQKPENTDPNK